MTRRYEFSRVEGGHQFCDMALRIFKGRGGLRQVLRNAIKSLLKRKKNAKNAKKRKTNQVKSSERYVTGRGGQAICYEALDRVEGV